MQEENGIYAKIEKKHDIVKNITDIMQEKCSFPSFFDKKWREIKQKKEKMNEYQTYLPYCRIIYDRIRRDNKLE